jgi:hypothetical protein
MGPKDVRSTVLTKEEEVVVITFRKYTLLPLDDCLYALQPSIPHLMGAGPENLQLFSPPLPRIRLRASRAGSFG